MNWRFWRGEAKARTLTIDQLVASLEAIYKTASGIAVDPESCMRSPTVNAIVTAVSRRVSVSPVHVYRKRTVNGRTVKELQPNHPVAQVLNFPNEFQDRVTFWLDMVSQLVRYENCFCWKGIGGGITRRLIPFHAGHTSGKFDEQNRVMYTGGPPGGDRREYTADRIWHARGMSRDFLNGDSRITDVREAIALEIAAEQFGATFFGNGAVPLLVFSLMDGFAGWPDDEARDRFLESVKRALGRGNQHSAFVLPKGIDLDPDKFKVDNNKGQMIETRKFQRTVIAGAFGVPPHMVGDLERATFNNVEQQDKDFTSNVVLPYVRMLEASLERDLLSPQMRNNGIIVRFNLDAILRASFKDRQEGLQIQRLNGIINANDWAEIEGRNPIAEDDGGEAYWMPSNYQLPQDAEDPPPEGEPPPGDTDEDEPETDQ